jgi:cytochrome c oxidase subunit 2
MRENMIKGFYGMMAGIVAFVPNVLAAADVVEPPKPFSPSNWDWTSILYIALALLIVFVCARAFDIAKVTETSTGKKVIDWNKTNAMIGVAVFILLAAGCWYEFAYHSKYILLGNSASEHGETIDSMFRWTFGFTFVVFAITETLLFYFMWRYSYKEGKKAEYFFHNSKLELVWTIVPAIVLTFLVLRGFTTWSKITNVDDAKTEKIEVFAYQFGWKARFPGADGKLGNNNYNLISANNPLGVVSKTHAEELLVTLKEDIKTAETKLANIDAQIGAWAKEYDDINQGRYAYPDLLKQAKDKWESGTSGAYERELKKEIKRKTTAITRIEKYMAQTDFFNNDGLDDLITTEIVLVKGQPYLFKFRARDVIHSAYMPEFRAQMNCVPGMGTQFAFTPIITTEKARETKNNKEFDYYLYCNKICGGAHYNMKIKVTVVNSKAEQVAFLAQQAPLYVEQKANSSVDSTQAIMVENAVTIK